MAVSPNRKKLFSFCALKVTLYVRFAGLLASSEKRDDRRSGNRLKYKTGCTIFRRVSHVTRCVDPRRSIFPFFSIHFPVTSYGCLFNEITSEKNSITNFSVTDDNRSNENKSFLWSIAIDLSYAFTINGSFYDKLHYYRYSIAREIDR